MDTEEEPRPRPGPPPPAPPFLGYKRYHKAEVPRTSPLAHRASLTHPPPPPRRVLRWYEFKRYYNQSNQKMKKEEVPPPPPLAPPFLGYRRYHNPNNILIEEEKLLPPPPPPPPPPLPPSPFLGQSSKEKDKVVHQPPPPPPLRVDSKSHLALKRYSEKSNRREVPRPPPRPLNHNQNPLEKPICLLSHPTLLHNLSRRSGGNAKSTCFACCKQKSFIKDYTLHHYYCTTCDVEFHHGCHKFPRKATHPYHLQHPLTFTFRNYETGIISEGNIDESFADAVLSNSEANTSAPEKSGFVETSRSQSNVESNKCTWCGRNIEEERWFYRCSTCNFCLDLSCYETIPPLVVPNPKSHHHSLVFYPRPLFIPCDACGLVSALEPSYTCFRCNYVVHKSCIDLPRVIKITRHQHRLSYTPYLQSSLSLCRVCYKVVDNKYGQFSCNHDDCSYIVHSKCATHENIWDKKELEWEAEETDEAEDIAPFKKVGSDMIKHFSHEHLLKLEKFDGVRDAEKQCQACILPINSRDFYNCIQCEFFLHEVCAGLLRKLDHALHVHPLVLDPSPQARYIHNGCLVCSRKSTGFRYKCSMENCELFNKAQIDVCCILVPEYLTHKAHDQHCVFICTTYKGKSKIFCKGCKKICLQSYLQCSVCEFAMCYECATIPNEVSYKHDKHPLSLCYGETVPDGIYWCEVCEKKVNPKDWFYACNKCCITIHLQCVFGSSAYMKPGSILYRHFTKLEVFRNTKSTRQFCTACRQRCPSSVYYKMGWLGMRTFCSLNCF